VSRYLHAGTDHTTGAYDAIRADLSIIQYSGIVGDQASNANAATVYDRAVTNDHMLTDIHVGTAMDHSVVLDDGLTADLNVREVASDDGTGPDAGVFTYLYIADDHGCSADKRARRNLGGLISEFLYHL
jgi:hypothetical protein